MQGQRVYFSDQNLFEFDRIEGTNSHFQSSFKTFLFNFNRDNDRTYHQRISNQLQKKRYVLTLELEDLKNFEEHLYERFMSSPMDILKVMQDGVRSYVKEKREELHHHEGRDEEWQVAVRSD